MKKLLSVLTVFLLALGLVACSSNPTTDTPAEEKKTYEISIPEADKTVTLKVGDEKTFAPTFTEGATLVWDTTDASIVEAKDGKIIAKKVGSATVTITVKEDRTKKVEIKVTVEEKVPEKITYSLTLEGTTTVALGETIILKPTLTPAKDDAQYTWSVDNANATISATGALKGAKIGDVKVTCALKVAKGEDPVTATFDVKVVSPTLTKITISGKNSLALGETTTLTYALDPALAVATVAWESKDATIASVDANGLVTALKQGTVKIAVTATQDAIVVSDEIEITVTAANPTSCEVVGETALAVGTKSTYTATLAPAGCNENVTWSTSNDKVATISATGELTALAAGTVKVICTTADANVVGEITVTISATATSVVIYGQDSFYVKATESYKAIVVSTQASQEVTWSVSDPSIATVDANGVLKGVTAGTVTLKASVNDTVYAEKEVTIKAGVVFTNNIAIDPSSNAQTGDKVIIGDVEYVYGTTLFKSLNEATIADNTRIILLTGEYGAYTLNANNILIEAAKNNTPVFNGVLTLADGINGIVFYGIHFTGLGQVLGTDNNSAIGFMNCIFDACSTTAAEGTIYFPKKITNLKIESCQFINNKAARCVRFDGNLYGMTINNCVFSGSGGFDFIRSNTGIPHGYISITNCEFTNSSQSGIMFSLMGEVYLEILNNKFTKMNNVAVDLRTTNKVPCISYYNISYNVFDNTDRELNDSVWNCIRLRYDDYTNDTLKVDINYNKFINWNNKSHETVVEQATKATFGLLNCENNYYSFNEISAATFDNSASKFSAISEEKVDKAIALFNLDNTDETVKLVGSSDEYTKLPYSTLAGALYDAKEGDIIYLLPGTYAENVKISVNNLTIRSLVYGEEPETLVNNAKNAIYTGTITIAAGLKNLTIDGIYFDGAAQILSEAGTAGTADATNTNMEGFNFINNYVNTQLTSGKGFIYFTVASNVYSSGLYFYNNYFNGKAATLDALVYLDNCREIEISYNKFVDASGMGFYVNDTSKGLSGQYDAIVSNEFTNCKNGLWINWLSALPNKSQDGEVYIMNNKFTNITEKAFYLGCMNNVDVYKQLKVEYNTFEKVNIAIYLQRVSGLANLTCHYNVFLDVPTGYYYYSEQKSTATIGQITAKYNAFLDGAGNFITPDMAKFKVDLDLNATIDLEEPVDDINFMPVFEEFATEITIFDDEEVYVGEAKTIEVIYSPSSDVFYKKVNYIVEDETILTITNGVMNPLASGTTKVTAVYEKNPTIKWEFVVTVKEYDVLELRYEGNGVLKAGDTVNVVATLENAEAGTTVEWLSSDETIATVDNTGKVTAVGKGVVTITCKIAGKQKSATVGFSVVDSSLANELLKLLVDANNGVIMYEEINYCGYESGYEAVPHYVYGSANKYYAATLPEIVQNPIPSTNQNCEWEEREGGIQLVCVHDTGAASPSSNAYANSKWCTNTTNTNTSWHYTIGNDGIYQQLEDKYVAWHAGDGSATKSGQIDTGVVATEPGRATVTIENGFYKINGQLTTCAAPQIVNEDESTRTATTEDIVDSGIVTFIGADNHYYIGTYYNKTYKKIATYGGYSSIGIETAVNTGSDVYLTWQRTAKFAAGKLLQYGLTLDRLVFHNNLSGKNCPQTMRTANKCEMFKEMVEIEYLVKQNYSDWTITFTSSNPDVLDNSGRVVGNGPRETTRVNYTITVTKGAESASQECSVLVIGTRNAK